MLSQPTQYLMKGLFPCLLLGNVSLPVLAASPGGKQGSAIVPYARQQIKITASVRPTLELGQRIMASDGNRAICIWSNMPTMNYDVEIEADRARAISMSHSSNEPADIGCSTIKSGPSLLKKLETSNGNGQMPGVVTLIIAPH